VVCASGARCPARLVDEFTADYIFNASGEVVDMVEAFEQPTTGYRAGRDHRFRGVSRVREEDTMHSKAGEVGMGRWSTDL
jgi:hypothetical protein